MDTKIRTQIYREPDQEVRLKRRASVNGVPAAERIRQVIDRHRTGGQPDRHDLQAWESERTSMTGLSLHRGRWWERAAGGARIGMRATILADTNVRVSTDDRAAGGKQQRALDARHQLIQRSASAITTQVLAECVVTVTRTLAAC